MPHKVNYSKRKNRYYTCHQRNSPSDAFFKNRKLDQRQDENEQWYNSNEAAKFLSITPNALRILVHRAQVKFYKLGRRLRFRKIDLNEVLQAMEN